MVRNRVLVEAFAFTAASLVVFAVLPLAVGAPLVTHLAGLEEPWLLLVVVGVTPFALLGGYRWLKHQVVRPGVA